MYPITFLPPSSPPELPVPVDCVKNMEIEYLRQPCCRPMIILKRKSENGAMLVRRMRNKELRQLLEKLERNVKQEK